MDAKTLLLNVLTKEHNKTEQEITEQICDEAGEFKDNAPEILHAMDAARVSKFKAEKETAFKNGEAKTVERVKKEAVKAVKEAFDIDSDSDILDEVLETGKTQIAEKTTQKIVPPTEEQVKKEAWFIKFEKERMLRSEHEAAVNEHNTFKQGIEEEKTFSLIREKAIASLKKLNPNFELYKDSPEILQTLTDSFINSMKEYKYQIQDGDNILILKPNGDRLDNPAGWPETMDSLVAQKATKFFTLLKQSPKGAPGNEEKNPDGTTKVKANPTTFKTIAEYNAYMKSLKDTPEDDKKMVEAMNIYKQLVKEGAIAE